MTIGHDWDEGGDGGIWCCRRCGAVAEQNDTYDGFEYSRPECIDLPNVIPMTQRRVAQIRADKRVVVEKFDGTVVTITEEPA